MSAYALPGLFPPIDDHQSTCWTSTESTSTTGSSLSGREHSSYALLGNDAITNDERKKCKEDHETSSTSTNTTLTSSYSSFCSLESIQQLLQSTQPQQSETIRQNHREGDRTCMGNNTSPVTRQQEDCSNNTTTMFGVSVKEAKIDPVRLVQFLTGTATTSHHHHGGKTLRRRGSKERLTSSSSSSCCSSNGSSVCGSSQGGSSPVNRKPLVQSLGDSSTATGSSCMRRRDCKGTTGSKTESNTSSTTTTTPHDDAIEFELSISFNGRKYTAKRTMQCIVKLRDDLIREMNLRKQWLTTSCSLDGNTTTNGLLYNPSTTTTTANTTASKTIHDNNDTYNVQIPEIPPLLTSSMTGGMGFVGRGFTMLHAMVTSYVPVLERWLKNVMDIVPQDSECLMNFLWEPTSSSTINMYYASSSGKTSIFDCNKEGGSNKNNYNENSAMNSFDFSLGSIKEIDSEDEL